MFNQFRAVALPPAWPPRASTRDEGRLRALVTQRKDR